jgi:hypothetical protein
MQTPVILLLCTRWAFSFVCSSPERVLRVLTSLPLPCHLQKYEDMAAADKKRYEEEKKCTWFGPHAAVPVLCR